MQRGSFLVPAMYLATPDRSNLLGITVNMLTTLNFIFRSMIGYEDKRTGARARTALMFAYLNAQLEEKSPANMDELVDEEYGEDVHEDEDGD